MCFGCPPRCRVLCTRKFESWVERQFPVFCRNPRRQIVPLLVRFDDFKHCFNAGRTCPTRSITQANLTPTKVLCLQKATKGFMLTFAGNISDPALEERKPPLATGTIQRPFFRANPDKVKNTMSRLLFDIRSGARLQFVGPTGHSILRYFLGSRCVPECRATKRMRYSTRGSITDATGCYYSKQSSTVVMPH